MFTEGIDMSRFFDFSLYKRTDELLRPAEKDLSGRFHATENIQLVYSRARSEVSPDIPYPDVTRTMDAVFRLAITTENLPRVQEMNTSVLTKLRQASDQMTTSQEKYTERVFANHNVPTRILPRPSYSPNQNYDVDEENNIDHDTIELLRR